MNALSHTTISLLPNNLRAQYTPGLQGPPPTSLTGACTFNFERLSLFVNSGSGGFLAGLVRVLYCLPTTYVRCKYSLSQANNPTLRLSGLTCLRKKRCMNLIIEKL
jgi:hypothetical protein